MKSTGRVELAVTMPCSSINRAKISGSKQGFILRYCKTAEIAPLISFLVVVGESGLSVLRAQLSTLVDPNIHREWH